MIKREGGKLTITAPGREDIGSILNECDVEEILPGMHEASLAVQAAADDVIRRLMRLARESRYVLKPRPWWYWLSYPVWRARRKRLLSRLEATIRAWDGRRRQLEKFDGTRWIWRR